MPIQKLNINLFNTSNSPYSSKLIVDFTNVISIPHGGLKNFLKSGIKEKPFPHQETIFRKAVCRKKFGIFAEQRTGKTMTTIGIMDWAVKKDNVKRILIICPTTVIGSWLNQIEYYSNLRYKIFSITGCKDEVKLNQLVWKNCEAEIVVANYQATWRKLEEFKYFDPNMLILDESHNVKNGQSNQHKAVYYLSKSIPWKLLLSGTPISNSPIDIFQQYKIMDPTLFGSNKSRFIDQYCIMDPRFPRKFRKYKDLAGFTEIYKLAMYRVQLKDVIKDMPSDLNKFYEVSFSKKEQKIYDTMKDDALLELKAGTVSAPIALSKLLRLHEICGGFLPVKELDSWDEDLQTLLTGKMEYYQVTSAKLSLLYEVLMEIVEKDPDEKFVIFHRYKPESDGIIEVLKTAGIKYKKLSSEMTVEQRTTSIEEFQNNPEIKAFVTPSSIGGVGIKLSIANTTIFYSTDFSSINYEQAKARTRDLSKNKPILHIHLIIKNTVDKYIYRMLEKKLNISGMPLNEIYNIVSGADFNEVDSYENNNFDC
jgi:SNF2 family DNA or RNA helicase